VALRDIRRILSRPALARLAKIERVAEEVAGAGQAADQPARLLASSGDDRHKTRSGPLLMSKTFRRIDLPAPGRRGWPGGLYDTFQSYLQCMPVS
jgi:hypothetical protein